MPVNAVCHVEWMTADFEKAKRFYGGLFDWTFAPFSDDYLLWRTADGASGGGFEKGTPEPGKSPAVYVQVANVDASLAKAVELGGTIVVGKEPIPGVGHLAIVADTEGSRVGLIETDEA